MYNDPLTILYEAIKKNPHVQMDGTTVWVDDQGKAHREDGPAIIYKSGAEIWCIHGKKHRLDGPAYITKKGNEFYFLDDSQVPEYEWLSDARVIKAHRIKKLEDKEIKDDDFLRTFGKIL